MGRVTVVDYGMGNLLSVRRALEAAGAEVVLTSDPETVVAAERLVVPGVGAFADGMRELRRRGLTEAIQSYASSRRPLLGICLGLQLLMEEGTEFGAQEGIGVLPGRVVELPRLANGRPVRVPHIGWSAIRRPTDAPVDWWRGSPLEPLHEGAHVYFVHSYVVEPADPSLCLAEVETDDWTFAAALRSNGIVGTQFHPEKSGPAGLAIVERFVRA